MEMAKFEKEFLPIKYFFSVLKSLKIAIFEALKA
jgi:hypothetical protein